VPEEPALPQPAVSPVILMTTRANVMHLFLVMLCAFRRSVPMPLELPGVFPANRVWSDTATGARSRLSTANAAVAEN
jgi:hypothetical protein